MLKLSVLTAWWAMLAVAGAFRLWHGYATLIPTGLLIGPGFSPVRRGNGCGA